MAVCIARTHARNRTRLGDVLLEEVVEAGDGPARRGAAGDGDVVQKSIERRGDNLAVGGALAARARLDRLALHEVVEADALRGAREHSEARVSEEEESVTRVFFVGKAWRRRERRRAAAALSRALILVPGVSRYTSVTPAAATPLAWVGMVGIG
jgi:hypothetical protein